MTDYTRVNRDWLPKEDKMLLELRKNGWSYEFISQCMQRPYHGVRLRHSKLVRNVARCHPSELH